MWTMGYNEGGVDSFNGGRKLCPLIPRLSSCPTVAANTNSDHRFNILTAEQKKRELMMLNSEPQHTPVMVSSRWNPTQDQLRVLEELYQQGTRTPSADLIQEITAELRRYGKIEGKNVFYWFQNHKARERQKRRRQMETQQHGQEDSAVFTTNPLSNHGLNNKDQPGYKVEQTKNNWIRSVGCDTQQEKPHDDRHHQEEPISAKRNGRHGRDGRQMFIERDSTWQMLQLPRRLYSSTQHHHLILNSTTVSSNVSNSNSTTVSDAKDTATLSPLFLSTRLPTSKETCLLRSCDDNKNQEQFEDCFIGESDHQEHTLELFPLRKEGFSNNSGDGEKENESGLHYFYEFLPLKS